MNTFRPLRELITFRGGGTPPKDVVDYWNGSIPWATVKDFKSTSLKATQDYITDAGLKNSSTNLIPKGHVIIPTRMALGKAAINEIDMAINQDLRALIPKVALDSRYLMYAVISLREEIIKKGSGATVKGITQEELYELEIPYPPLDDQIRIAHLLGKAEGLIAQRKQHLQQLDDLLKSVFLDMFGDPVTNPKGWPSPTLGDVLTFQQYGPRFYNEAYSADGIRIVRITDLSETGDLNFSAMPRLSVSSEDREKYTLQPGDLIFARTGATVGKVALMRAGDPPAIAGAYFITMRFKKTLLPMYARAVLTAPSIRTLIASRSRQAAQQNFSGPGLRKLPMPLPPIELQREFAARVEGIEKLRASVRSSLTELDALFASLQRRAFSGELDLSRVPLKVDFSERTTVDDKALLVDSSEIGARIANLDRAAMATPDGRNRLLQQSFATWLQNPANQGTSSMTEFWRTARMNTLDYSDEETGSPEFSLPDYDALKQWVFDEIAQARISQTLNTKIVPGEAINSGSEIVLRKAK